MHFEIAVSEFRMKKNFGQSYSLKIERSSRDKSRSAASENQKSAKQLIKIIFPAAYTQEIVAWVMMQRSSISISGFMIGISVM